MKIRYITVFILLSYRILYSQQLPVSHDTSMNMLAGMWYEVALSPPDIRGDCRCNTIDFEYIQGKPFIRVSFRCILFKNQKSRVMENRLRFYPAGITGIVFKPGRLSGDYYHVVTFDNDQNMIVIYNSRRNHLHLLSRDSYLPSYKFNDVLKLLSQKGYNSTTLQKTSQNCDIFE